jgi:S-formylglutathione hydrolase FrmB
MKRRLWLRLAALGLLAAPQGAKAGGVLAERFVSPGLGREWPYNVYLPQGYETGTKRYPVVYMLHGASQDEAAWVRDGSIDALADKLIARGDIPPCIIIMPAGWMTWYTDAPERIETAFVTDLIPEIERRYRTRPLRGDRVIAGFSMGGYGAMRMALRHPELFSAAALMSPAIYVPQPPADSSARLVPAFQTSGVFDPKRWSDQNWPALLDGFARAGLTVRVHVSSGAQDHFHADLAAEAFYTAWHQRGWPGELHVTPGQHDFPFWRRAAPGALRYLLNPQPVVMATKAKGAPP